MHTTQGKRTIFNHNGDFSGEVRIFQSSTQQEMWVPFDDLKTLVAAYVRNRRIGQLEQASDDEILHG